MKVVIVSLLLIVASTGAQSNFQCLHDFGYYPHEVACDKYWACDGAKATLKTCGNGLAFDDGDAEFLTENCDYYHNVDCSTRPERQPAISSPNCPYQYGIFADTEDCTVFWSCWGAEASRYQCGPGLAYSTKSRVCTWSDKVPECNKQRADLTQDFKCPAAGELVATSSFTRHAHPEDCRKYYVCLDGIPREYGCPIGTVFQIGTQEGFGQCADPADVQGCEDYYGELNLDTIRKSQLLLGQLGLKGQLQGSRTDPKPQPQQQQQPRDQAASSPRNPPRSRQQQVQNDETLLQEGPLV